MKKTNILSAIAGLALLAGSAQAGTVTSSVVSASSGQYATTFPGDIFLGFSSSSAGKNYVIDLGSIDNVKAFDVSSSLSIGGDLTTVFGASWYTTSDLTWGLFGLVDDNGGGDPVELLVSSAKGSVTDASSLAVSGVIQTAQHGQLDAIVNQLNFDANYGRALTYGVYQNNGNNGDSKANNMWLGIADTAAPFGIYNQSIVASATFTGAGDTNRSNLALFDVSADGVTVTPLINFLALDAQGTVTVVPEPSTWMLLGVGALLMVVAYRRKANA